MPDVEAAGSRAVGVVYTREWVVQLMLDLVGYAANEDLGADTIVEPGCGDGAFLTQIVARLIDSASRHARDLASLHHAIRACDVDPAALVKARDRVRTQLHDAGVPPQPAEALVNSWIIEADFLLDDLGIQARWVVGNPPYVRVEEANADTYKKYRARWSTMSGRADLYIGFFEAGLKMLKPGGELCFICADRWMHNQYGSALRKYVIENHSMRLLLEVHESDVFDAQVAAYPAVTVMRRAEQEMTALATARSTFDGEAAARFIAWWRGDRTQSSTDEAFTAATIEGRFQANSSWPSGPPERLLLIANLEQRYPSLVEVGIKVGVGIATGADKVYVVSGEPDIEPDLLKRAIGPADILDGHVAWRGRLLISPWVDNQLAPLESYPRLKRYFESTQDVVKARYVAKRNAKTWWRTIDRPPADEYVGPKLVVADINDRIEPVLDRDGYWPLHSAYFITSDTWDLEVLGGYLLSDVAAAFVEAYSVKMANGHLRISAQYLKKIRLPPYAELTPDDRAGLAGAFHARDRGEASIIVRRVTNIGSADPGQSLS